MWVTMHTHKIANKWSVNSPNDSLCEHAGCALRSGIGSRILATGSVPEYQIVRKHSPRIILQFYALYGLYDVMLVTLFGFILYNYYI